MKTLYKLPLLDPKSGDGFQHINLTACDEAPCEWSVKSYTLHGGLQEGVQVVEINNGKLCFAVLPTRGMSIWKGQCGEVELGWDSPVKDPVHPAFINLEERGGLGWLKGFNEWFVRCGLNSMGPPSMDTVLDYSGNAYEVPLTLHGKIANIPARAVDLEITKEAIILRGEVDESMMFGPALRLNTEIRTELNSGAMSITDTITNLGSNPQEHEMLYHINYGGTLLEKGSQLVTPFKQIAPRDPRSAEGIEEFSEYGGPQAGFVEQAYYYDLVGKRGSRETIAMLRNASGSQASVLRFSLEDFPYFVQWKNTNAKADGYVTGLEPTTSYPNTRRYEREKGRVITLDGGESRTTKLTIEVLDTKKAVKETEREIKQMQKTVKQKVHPNPMPRFSGG